MADALLPQQHLVRTWCCSYDCCRCRFFCRRWLSSGRRISRCSLLRCCRFNARRRILQRCCNNCNVSTIAQSKRERSTYLKSGKTLLNLTCLNSRRYLWSVNTCDTRYVRSCGQI